MRTLLADDDGAASLKDIAAAITIKANRAPRALFSASPLSGKGPLPVTFTNQSSDLDGTVMQWCWNFAEGVTGCNSTEANPTHTFTVVGNHNVELIVTDESGAQSAPYRRRVTVVANKVPRALFSSAPASGTAPLLVAFTNKSTDADGTIVGFCWNFAEGVPGCNSTEANPTHTFAPGVNRVTLVVTDNSGGTSVPYTRSINARAP